VVAEPRAKKRMMNEGAGRWFSPRDLRYHFRVWKQQPYSSLNPPG